MTLDSLVSPSPPPPPPPPCEGERLGLELSEEEDALLCRELVDEASVLCELEEEERCFDPVEEENGTRSDRKDMPRFSPSLKMTNFIFLYKKPSCMPMPST